MTDKELIKSLECCSNETVISCNGCFLQYDKRHCTPIISREALNLINRQKSEIERLQIRNKTLTDISGNYDWKFAKVKSEVIKEFAKRLKEIAIEKGSVPIVFSDIDNLVKEMTDQRTEGENEEKILHDKT